ncbi:retrovirus-related pol polyprotein from transposon TNT 1-94 [Tanacetum coccineum]
MDLLFGPLYDEFFTVGTSSVNKSSSPSVNSQQQDTQPTVNIHPTTEPITPTRIVHAEETNDNQAEDAHFEPYEFVNPFCTPIQELAESSSRNLLAYGFVDPDHPEKVYRLRKALYRLKQAPRAWYDETIRLLDSKGTINMAIWYPKDSGFELTDFLDADHAGCLDTRKSTCGGIHLLGDKLVSWMSKKQDCTECHQQKWSTLRYLRVVLK